MCVNNIYEQIDWILWADVAIYISQLFSDEGG